MNVKKVYDMIQSFTSFDEASHFLKMYPNFGADIQFPELNHRQFITAVLIEKFPDDILSSSNYDQFLITTSKQLVNGILNQENVEQIRLRAKAYNHIFNLWKKQDKTEFLNYLGSVYLTARNTLFLISQNLDILPEDVKQHKEEEINELEKYMNKVKTSIEQLDKTFLSTYLKNKKEPEEIQRDVMNQISQTMYKTFWKLMLDELEKGNYEPAFKNLEEGIVTLNKLHKIEFDLEYYKHLVNQKLFTQNDLVNIANFFVQECKKRGAPEDDKYSDEELEKWKQKEGSISFLFVEFLQILFELIGRINLRLYLLTQKIV